MCLQVYSSRSRLQLAGGAQLTALYLDCFVFIAYQRLRFMLFWGLGTIVLRLSVVYRFYVVAPVAPAAAMREKSLAVIFSLESVGYQYVCS